MNRRIQSFYRALKEDKVMQEITQNADQSKRDDEEEAQPPPSHRRLTMPRMSNCPQHPPPKPVHQSKAKKRWTWAVEKIRANLDEMLDMTYSDSYCIVLPQSMQKKLEDNDQERSSRLLEARSRVKQGPPTHSKQRANRYTATFQLQKLMAMIAMNKAAEEKERLEREQAAKQKEEGTDIVS
jgi:hypothetical protein